jgi:hypothetical protein
MSDNTTFWEAFGAGIVPEVKKIKSERNIITSRFAKIRYETKSENQFAVDKREFKQWSLVDTDFIEAYEKYAENGDKKYSPVIELKDKNKGYGLENMKWVCQSDKNRKNGKAVKIINSDKKELIFLSARKAELEFKLPRGVLNRALRTEGKYKRLKISFV